MPWIIIATICIAFIFIAFIGYLQVETQSDEAGSEEHATLAGTRQVVLIIFIAWIFIALIFISWIVIAFIASLCYLQVKKQPKKRKPKIDEQFKLKLLHHYLMNAPNLTVRDVGEGRANIKKQLKAIFMMGVRMEDKDSSSLANFDLDNIRCHREDLRLHRLQKSSP